MICVQIYLKNEKGKRGTEWEDKRQITLSITKKTKQNKINNNGNKKDYGRWINKKEDE